MQKQKEELATEKRNQRLEKAREAQRRRAPGLSEGGDILQPTRVSSENQLMGSLRDLSYTGTSTNGDREKIDFEEFEGKGSEADPWDASLLKQTDDLKALKEVMNKSLGIPVKQESVYVFYYLFSLCMYE